MGNPRRLRGTELRYVLTTHLFSHGRATIAELVEALAWEVRRGRVYRLGRGRYGPGWMPRGTEHRIHRRVMALRAAAWRLSLRGGQKPSRF